MICGTNASTYCCPRRCIIRKLLIGYVCRRNLIPDRQGRKTKELKTNTTTPQLPPYNPSPCNYTATLCCHTSTHSRRLTASYLALHPVPSHRPHPHNHAQLPTTIDLTQQALVICLPMKREGTARLIWGTRENWERQYAIEWEAAQKAEADAERERSKATKRV
ncbi:hypothetical protein P152DRAFT_140413 [Eremomyces bilateralis CBS 781.70]|uniref:Uncharacterized protein n=1 Tax=Eremomyces bilateralis CBS 781.70 TaxID=1392243 RepID=A0A6G1FWH3_9PEZI|nr:uncharacterized protein P152DRAFT_140413 [Eremomyces bilateralis CBS 781.70]KAF1810124.1 hypothetical protein P152DRAFT_140413 [Eremomyces bilateralis CBS 781.70]